MGIIKANCLFTCPEDLFTDAPGIEPASPPRQGGILTTILYVHIATTRIELVQSRCKHNMLPLHHAAISTLNPMVISP
jgi:hypothetical protein